MNAMTWWDHKTESVWSQVWGQAIAGPLKGTTLELIPASIVPWRTWQAEHPDTLALDVSGYGFGRNESPSNDWVVGLAIGEHKKAYYFTDLIEAGVLNDTVGPYPIALYADAATRNVHVYLRQLDDRVLTLKLDETGQFLADVETDRQWRLSNGLPTTGDPQTEALYLVPYISSFDWAWRDFHPRSQFFGQE